MHGRNVRLFALVGLLTSALVVVAAPAQAVHTVSSISPTSAAQGQTVAPFTVTGTGFSSVGGTPTVTVSGTGVTVTGVVLTGSTTLTGQLNVTEAAATGARTVTVTQQAVDTANCTNCLTILAGPKPTSIAPSAASNGGSTPTPVTVTGTAFSAGVQLTLVNGAFTIPATEGTTTATSIPATFDLVGQPPLTYDVVVTNANGGIGRIAGGFAVGGSQPTLTAVTSPVGRGATNKVLHLTGTNLARGATVAITPATGITVGTPVWVSLTQIDVPVTVDGTAPLGAHDVKVTNTDTLNATCTGCLTVTAAPTITSVVPNSRGQGAASANVDVTGTGFAAGATLTIAGGGVNITNIIVTATHVTADVTVDPTAATGSRVLTVLNTDGGSATSTFTVNPGPTLTTVAPSSRGQGSTNQQVVLTGTGFVAGATVAFSGTLVTLNGPVVVNSATQLTIHVDVAPAAAAGPRDVTVTNTDGGTITKVGGFVVGNSPTITGINPSSRGRNSANQLIAITGTGFVSGVVVTMSNPTGITINSTAVDSATQITLSVSVANTAALAGHDVTVTNADAGSATSVNGFTVNAAPTVASVAPSSVGQGAARNVVVTGTGFASAGTTMPTVSFGTGVTTGTVTMDSATQLTVAITVASAATPGARDVVVTNPDAGVSAPCTGCFTVTAAPTVTSIAPNSAANSGPVNVDITGTGFVGTPTVVLERTGQADIPLAVTGTPTATHILGTFNLTNAPPGAWTVKVTNPDSGTARLVNGFTIAGSTPALTGVAPNSLVQGHAQTVTLTGSGFASGATITVSGTGVTVTATNVSSATTATATFTVAAAAAPGARNVTLTNTDAQAATCTGCFTVVATPVITTVAPASLPAGAVNRSVVVTGSGFQTGVVAAFSGTLVTVNSLTRDSATQLTLSVSVDPAAARTARDLTITNTDGGTTTKTGALTVTDAPTITSLNPTSIGQGATNKAIVVTGTGFATTPTVTFSGSGVTAASVVRDSATQLTVMVTAAPGAAVGARDITVTNPDGGAATMTGALTVTAQPTITSVVPGSVNQGATNQSIVITGTNFQASPTVTFAGSGITINSVVRNPDTQLTVNISVAGSAALGARDVTVSNPDGGTATAPGGLTVTGPAGRFTSLTPVRLLDTRESGQGPCLGPDAVRTLKVTGVGGVPSTGVGSVAVNVTATGPTTEGYLTVYPNGVTRPTASNLNFPPGRTIPNMVISKVGTDGFIAIYNNSGCTHIIVDIVGWYLADGGAPAPGGFAGLTPARLMDTRNPGQTCFGAGTRDLKVTSVGGVPATGVGAVAVNVTATGPTTEGYLTVYPKGVTRPTASNLNFVPGETIPNLVLSKVGADGNITIFNYDGCTHVIVDVVGWYAADGGAPAPGGFTGVTPARLLDTRDVGQSCFGPGATRDLKVTGVGGVPASGVGAVAVNVTATGPTAESYLTVYPQGVTRPTASNLNFVFGQTVPNLVLSKVSADGNITIFNYGGCVHVLVDVVGYFIS